MLTNENLSTVEGLTAEQITAITQISEHEATSWKTEQSATLNQAANTNANKIIEGMVGSVFKPTGGNFQRPVNGYGISGYSR